MLMAAHGLGFHVPDGTASAASTGVRWLFRNLDVELASGDQLALVGPSGSGKSTLLHLLAALIQPHEGDVLSAAETVSQRSESWRERWRRAHVGLVFQQFHLFGGLTALDNVLLPWTFDHARVPQHARETARDLLHALGLTSREAVQAHQLSRGEQQRIAVARALVRRPRLVLADEPTANLDANHAAQTCALMQDLCREQGAALVVATHDRAVAERLGRRLDLAGLVP